MTECKTPPQRRKKNRNKYKPKKWQGKVADASLTHDFLLARAQRALAQGYEIPKYVFFARLMLEEGYRVTMYEAQRTVSKYLSVHKEGYKSYKVRFSNHKPIPHRELAGDCDFFVGRTNLRVTTTAMALKAVREHFNGNNQATRSSQEELDYTAAARALSSSSF